MNQQYYNLYIETDEEVTTMISRLATAPSTHVALIVPQHALVLQSIINLRLLAREATKQNKTILLVTQDEEGVVFAKRVGIVTTPLQEWQEISRQNQGGSSSQSRVQGSHINERQAPYQQQVSIKNIHNHRNEELNARPSQQPITRQHQEIEHIYPRNEQQEIRQQQLSTNGENSYQIDTLTHHTQADQYVNTYENAGDMSVGNSKQLNQQEQERHYKENVLAQELPQQKNLPESEYQQKNTAKKSLFKRLLKKNQASFEDNIQALNSGDQTFKRNRPFKKIYRYGWILASLCILVIIGYHFLPYSTVVVRTGNIENKESLSINASADNTSVDIERRKIPLRVINKEITRKTTVPATGKANVSAQKAFGTIKIINTLDDQPQTLVATTRFRSPEGVVFRLVKGTTVPGITVDDDKVIPGTIEASVIADKVGAEGNIPATTWVIPGFENNAQKFAKFTAESVTPMTGGSAGDQNTSVATEADIAKAKKEAETNLGEYVVGEIQKLVAPTQELMNGALKTETVRAESAVTEGTAVDDVEYIITSKVVAYVFERSDVENIAKSILDSKNGELPEASLTIDYDSPKPNFTQEQLALTATAIQSGQSNFNEQIFREAIRGKNHTEIKELLKADFPYVRDISIAPYPAFPQSIGTNFSRYDFMTKITEENIQ